MNAGYNGGFMNSNDLKLFAIFYIKEDEVLTDMEKVKLMEYVENADDEKILFLLKTGTVFPISESGASLGIAIGADAIIGGMSAARLAKTGWVAGKGAYTGYNAYKSITTLPKDEKPWGSSTISLAGSAVSSLATAIAFKVNKKYMEKMKKKCDQEKGMAKKTCYNKIRRDAIRAEVVALTSMKVKCRKAKNADICVQNIDKRIKQLQKRMESIKIF